MANEFNLSDGEPEYLGYYSLPDGAKSLMHSWKSASAMREI